MVAPAPDAPRLRLARLRIEELRSLRRVRWPEDGLGWGDRIPDTVLVGGVNGSGKTTLLRLIFGLFRFMVDARQDADDFKLSAYAYLYLEEVGEVLAGLDFGVAQYELAITVHDPPPHLGAITLRAPGGREDLTHLLQRRRHELTTMVAAPDGPSLLYFPTDRSVVFPDTDYKAAGRGGRRQDGHVYRYRAAEKWEQSIEALLYDARWRDLNAKEQGHPEAATHFSAFQEAMQRFFAGAKRFEWDLEGVLHIKTRDGALHPLDALSSGELQVLLFVTELVRRWTPGSLVVIDEPELHLHEAWLAALWRTIGELQRERGGQVIVTTQSNYLFGLAEPGTRALLGGGL